MSSSFERGEMSSDRVLSSFETVKRLNEEAGHSNASIEAILVRLEGRREYLDKFSSDIVGYIQSCFKHFRKVRPHLAKVRAHQEFHQLRLKSLPLLWKSLTTTLGLPELDPLNSQSMCRVIFDSIMKESVTLHQPTSTGAKAKEKIRLLGDEQNAVRYASGFVVMKISKRLEKKTDSKAAQFRECLSQMANSRENTSFYKYTLEWICSVDRGGLFYVNDNAFIFFETIELKIQELLPQFLSQITQCDRTALVNAVTDDEIVQQYWWLLAIDITEDKDADELLHMIVEMWVSMRGFSMTSMWMEEYKKATAKTVKKSKSLRKDLENKEPKKELESKDKQTSKKTD